MAKPIVPPLFTTRRDYDDDPFSFGPHNPTH